MRKRRALKIVSAIFLVCALAFAAFEILKLRNITVTGCESRSGDDIIALSGLEKGESIFLVDTDKAMKSLASDPYIKPVSVLVRYPDSVSINIKERKEAAYVMDNDSALIIDDECWLLKIQNDTADISYPEATGLSLRVFNVGERLGASDDFQLDMLSKVLTEAQVCGVGLKSVDVSIAADVVVETSDGYTVELGNDTNLSYKFQLLKSSVKKFEDMGKTGGIIDVAGGSDVYYREK